MNDHNEQQLSGDQPKKHQYGQSNGANASCGSDGADSQSWDSCSCDDETRGSAPADELVFSQSGPMQTETVFAPQTPAESPAARVDAADQQALWEDLVRSQQPERSASGEIIPVAVAKNPMQWTLVDLTSSGCSVPGCNPETCDEADCDTTDAYDRSEYELPEYTVASGRAPAVTFSMDDNREFAFQDGPSPAPTAFVPSQQDPAPQPEAVKPKKRATGKKAGTKVTVTGADTDAQSPQLETSAAETKRAKGKKAMAKKAKSTKAGGKKAAAKKTTAKKGAKKPAKGAKKTTAKKSGATRAKKGAAQDPSQPLPINDPNFPRTQAA